MAHSSMTATEYRHLLERLNLSIIDAGRVFGFSPRQAYRYSAEGPIPNVVAKLVRLAAANRLTPEQIKRL